MKDIIRLAVLFIFIFVACPGKDLGRAFRAHQGGLGLWYFGGQPDNLGSAMAVWCLEGLGGDENRLAAARARMALLLHRGEEGPALLERLPAAMAESPPALDWLSSYLDGKGLACQEPGACGDLQSTALLCRFLAKAGQPCQELLDALSQGWEELEEDRLKLLVLDALAVGRGRSWDEGERAKAASALCAMSQDDWDALAIALAAEILFWSREWTMAAEMLKRLEKLELPEGGWSRNNGKEFDAMVTSYVCDDFENMESVQPATDKPDLMVTEAGLGLLRQERGGEFSCVVFNGGSTAVLCPFDVSVVGLYADGGRAVLHTASFLGQARNASQSFRLNLESLEGLRGLLVVVDEAGIVQESDKENNVAYLSLDDSGDRVCWAGSMLVDGCRCRDVYFLNDYGMMSVELPFFQSDGRTTCEWYDNGVLVEQSEVMDKGVSVLRLSCHPSEGDHEIRCVIGEGEGQIVRSVSFEIVPGRLGVLVLNAQYEKCSRFGAWETFLIQVRCDETADGWLEGEVTILDDRGMEVGKAVHVNGQATLYEWNTGGNRSGSYRIRVFWTYWDMEEVHAETTMEIYPQTTLESLDISGADETIVAFAGGVMGLNVKGTVDCFTNEGGLMEFDMAVKDMEGNVLVEENGFTSQEIGLAGRMQSFSVYLPEFEIGESGLYVIVLTIRAKGQSVGKMLYLQLEEAPTVQAENTLSPSEIGREEQRVAVNLELSGSGTTLAGRVATFVVLPEIIYCSDENGAEADICLVQVEDCYGNAIARGSLGFSVKYGAFYDMGHERTGRAEGDTIILPVIDGEVELCYTPTGGLLAKGQTAVIAIGVHQVNKGALGQRIGSIEVLLKGGSI